jgi:uncharacterized hydrophobic protein (TIGR00271 family)
MTDDTAISPGGERPRANPLVHLLKQVERRLHGWTLRMLELDPEDHLATVEEMLTQRRRESIEYWTYLTLSMGIATLGLALNSTAVVIGAMLVSPLMAPIVHLAMGLVVGSPVLTLRSLFRVAGSVLVVILGAMTLTILLPFQEVTAEIAARTQPTALDLVLAVFVAIAAALSAVRSRSETTAAAVGAAIGIALIPPICVIGYGLGVADWDIAGGATLLFVTNLSAIVFIGVVFFWALGFERVDSRPMDVAVIDGMKSGTRAHKALLLAERMFESRRSRTLRALLPLSLVAAIAIPLSRGLDQVAWEIRTKGEIARLLDSEVGRGEFVQSSASVQRTGISIRLYMVGDDERAAHVERILSERIAAAAGMVPDVRVVPMADMGAFRQALAANTPSASVAPAADLARLRSETRTALAAAWPAEFGQILSWQVEVRDSGQARLRAVHWGEPLPEGSAQLLGFALEARMPTRLSVATTAIDPQPVNFPLGEGPRWIAALVRMTEVVRSHPAMRICATLPGATASQRDRSVTDIAKVSSEVLSRLPEYQYGIERAGTGWSFRLQSEDCTASP